MSRATNWPFDLVGEGEHEHWCRDLGFGWTDVCDKCVFGKIMEHLKGTIVYFAVLIAYFKLSKLLPKAPSDSYFHLLAMPCCHVLYTDW